MAAKVQPDLIRRHLAGQNSFGIGGGDCLHLGQRFNVTCLVCTGL